MLLHPATFTLFPYTTLFRSNNALPSLKLRTIKLRPRMLSLKPEVRNRKTSNRKRSEEHTSELQSPCNLVCRLLREKKKQFCTRYVTKSPVHVVNLIKYCSGI